MSHVLRPSSPAASILKHPRSTGESASARAAGCGHFVLARGRRDSPSRTTSAGIGAGALLRQNCGLALRARNPRRRGAFQRIDGALECHGVG